MYSEDLKIRAINYYYQVKSCRKVAYIFKIGKSTINRWISGKYAKSKKDNYNLTIIINFIKNIVIKNNFIRLVDIKQKIFDKFKKTLSISSIWTILAKKLNFKKSNKKNLQ